MGAGARQPWRGRHRPTDDRRRRGVRHRQAARRAGRGSQGGAVAAASGPSGVHPEARQTAGAAARCRSLLSAIASCRRPAKTVIEPIFEADMLECSFGFRPRRSTHDALQVLIDEAWRGRRWVAESDIANCFEAIPHSGLMAASRGADLRPPRPEALAGDAARGSHDRTERSRAAMPGRHRAGCSHPAWPTSTCTGSTGSGQTAAQACWSATELGISG